MMFYCYLHSEIVFGGDAYEIWELAKHFYEPDRQHSFVEYRGGFIFIFYNVIYYLSRLLHVDDVVVFRLYSSLLFAFLTSYIFPYLFSYMLSMKIGLLKLILFSITLFFFYRGYFLHPQTDVLAITFLLLSINVLIFITKIQKNEWLYYCAAGVLLACSVMTRFNYVLSIPFIVIFIVLTLSARQANKFRIIKLSAYFVVPCIVLVGANSIGTSNSNILKLKLKDGMLRQKIEWNAGDIKYTGNLVIPEKRGIEILRSEGIDPDPWKGISVVKYCSFYAEYPLDMLVISFQHLFNGLDITYNSVYVYDLHTPRIFLSLVNYCIIFLTLVIVTANISLWRLSKKYVLLLLSGITIPGVSAIPFMVEVRFFMPLTMTFIAISIFAFRDGINVIKANSLYMHFALFVAFCFLLSVSVLNSADQVIPLKIW